MPFEIEILNFEELEARVEKATSWSEEVNTLLSTTSIRELYLTNRVKFVLGKPNIKGLPNMCCDEYYKNLKKWMSGGAGKQLVDMLDKDVPGEIPKFLPGIAGSVWFDTILTGRGRTKMTRVSPHNCEELEGVLFIGVDPSNYDDSIKSCDGCGLGVSKTSLKKCAKCEKVWYCSKECQKNEWTQHKHKCKK